MSYFVGISGGFKMIVLTTKDTPEGESFEIVIDHHRLDDIRGNVTAEVKNMIGDLAELFDPEFYVPSYDLALAQYLQGYFPGELTGDTQIESEPGRIY